MGNKASNNRQQKHKRIDPRLVKTEHQHENATAVVGQRDGRSVTPLLGWNDRTVNKNDSTSSNNSRRVSAPPVEQARSNQN